MKKILEREWVTKEVLIVVKAYPNPSISHRESCCIAGITSEKEWIRIYPVKFRELRREKQPSKYDIFRMKVYKDKHDIRIESYRPDEESFEKIEHLKKWEERKSWILPMVSKSMCEIQRLSKENKKSLGIFKPLKVIDLIIEDDVNEWRPRQLAIIKQTHLFEKEKDIIEKIPYKFSYQYLCDETNCNGHKQIIVDWEIHELYRKLRDKYGDNVDLIKGDIKNKFLNELCGPEKDTYFFVGDLHWHPGSFIILGVFWPPIEKTIKLFN